MVMVVVIDMDVYVARRVCSRRRRYLLLTPFPHRLQGSKATKVFLPDGGETSG